MAFAASAETLILAVVAVLAIRKTVAAPPPHGRRLLWVASLVVLERVALYGFLAVQSRTGWGIAHASPPGLAALTQLARLALLLLAARVWLGVLAFAPGDTLIVYSDGVTEAEGAAPAAARAEASPTHSLFGEERLAVAARALRGRPAREVLEGVLAAVHEFAHGVEQADDITIVVVRRV